MNILQKTFLSCSTVVALVGLPVADAVAGTAGGGSKCTANEPGRGGLVKERGPAFSSYDVWLTDYQGKRIGNAPYAQLQGDANGNASVTVPSGMAGVCDVENDTILAPVAGGGGAGGGGGARAILKIESIYFDPTTNTYVLQNIFDTIANLAGNDAVVRIPDLYADTNDDGVLGMNDVLYSLVDLDAALIGDAYQFSFGDTYSIVDGAVEELPYMWFSSSPFSYDELIGFTGTPYSGTGVAASEHELQVPVPATLGLTVLGLLGLFYRRSRLTRR